MFEVSPVAEGAGEINGKWFLQGGKRFDVACSVSVFSPPVESVESQRAPTTKRPATIQSIHLFLPTAQRVTPVKVPCSAYLSPTFALNLAARTRNAPVLQYQILRAGTFALCNTNLLPIQPLEAGNASCDWPTNHPSRGDRACNLLDPSRPKSLHLRIWVKRVERREERSSRNSKGNCPFQD